MPELSPAARSVFESFNSKFDWVEDGVPGPQFKAIAAAIRAAADQVVPEMAHPDAEEWLGYSTWVQVESRVRLRLLAIAEELEVKYD